MDLQNNCEIESSNEDATSEGEQDQDDKDNVQTFFVPQVHCRTCELSYSNHILRKHVCYARPASIRIVKKKFYAESTVKPSVTSDSPLSAELSSKVKVNCNICHQVLDSHKGLKEHLECIHKRHDVGLEEKRPVKDSSERYIVILKGDGDGGVTDHRVKLSERPVQKHEINAEEAETSNGDTHICDTCGEEFISRISLIKHSCSVHEKVDVSGIDEVVMVECELCNRRLHNTAALQRHMARVHCDPYRKPVIKHQCKVCKFHYRTQTELIKHVKEKHGIDIKPQVACRICEKCYDASYIDRHIAIIHESGKKYSCKFCKMKFNDLVYMKRHIYFDHANDKWKCEKCQLEFKKYHQLRQHRTNVHSTVVHKCSDCEKTFKRKGDLTQHRKRSHEVRVPLICKYCSKSIIEPSKFRNHLIKQHGVAWEDTLSKHYARHQQENNCLRWNSAKYLKMSGKERSSKDCDQQEETQRTQQKIGFCKSDLTFEDHQFSLPELQYNDEGTDSEDDTSELQNSDKVTESGDNMS